MFKKLIMAAMAVGAAMCVNAGTLYWQISGKGDFSLANLWASDSNGNSSMIAMALAEGVNGSTVLTGTTTGGSPVQTDLSGYEGDGYTYAVELLAYADANGTQVVRDGWLTSYSYNDLVSSGYIVTDDVGVPSYAASAGWIPDGEGYAVPEPTSGMLFLIGGALIALRRRRRA